jgi:hypothetical protein
VPCGGGHAEASHPAAPLEEAPKEATRCVGGSPATAKATTAKAAAATSDNDVLASPSATTEATAAATAKATATATNTASGAVFTPAKAATTPATSDNDVLASPATAEATATTPTAISDNVLMSAEAATTAINGVILAPTSTIAEANVTAATTAVSDTHSSKHSSN